MRYPLTGLWDLVSALCDKIPSAVYCHWVGAPMSDADFVARTSHTVQQVHTREPRHTPAVVEAFEALIDYVDERIADRRRTPGDDLLSDLIRAEDSGQLNADDLRNWVIKLAEANTDNSSHQIAIAIIELASRSRYLGAARRGAGIGFTRRSGGHAVSSANHLHIARGLVGDGACGGCPAPRNAGLCKYRRNSLECRILRGP